MSNTLLTPDMITREALRILHQKLSFIGNIHRGYDKDFAKEGAKIGNTIRIRRPIEYTTATGATIATGTGADSVEQKFTLTVNTQRHVPLRFTSNELTMKVDDFSSRHIEPAMAKLSAMMENDALGLVDEVYNHVAAGTVVAYAEVLQGRKKMVDALAPMDNRCCMLDTQANVDLVDELKGLFHDNAQIKKQYKDGAMGHTASLDFYENTLLNTHTSGAEGGGSAYLCNQVAAQTSTDADSMSLIVDTGTKTVKKGDVFTIASVNRVHPESKVDTGVPQQFVALSNFTGAGTVTIAPGIVASGPRQNCSAGAVNNAKLTFVGAASTTYNQSLLFQKNAFAFGTADLVLPKGLDFASRQVYDGISMRILRDYDIVKDRVYTRLDVLYGKRRLYNQHAVKIHHT